MHEPMRPWTPTERSVSLLHMKSPCRADTIRTSQDDFEAPIPRASCSMIKPYALYELGSPRKEATMQTSFECVPSIVEGLGAIKEFAAAPLSSVLTHLKECQCALVLYHPRISRMQKTHGTASNKSTPRTPPFPAMADAVSSATAPPALYPANTSFPG